VPPTKGASVGYVLPAALIKQELKHKKASIKCF
jgi:hypothetical protein